MDGSGTAVLTEGISPEKAVAAVVSREEIAGALEDEGPAELFLQIVRPGEDGQEEHSTISIGWSREDLERLLERATTDRVVLTFDREQLAQALADVEAHGLRERALIFAVAAAGVLGTGAGTAAAMPVGDTGGAAIPAASMTLTDVSSASGYAAPAAASEGGGTVTDVSSGGGYAAPAAASEGGATVTDVSSGGGYAAPAAASEGGATVTDVSSGGGYAAPTAEPVAGGGSSFDLPTPVEGGIAAGVALAIAAAAFGTTRRSRTLRPG